MNAKCRVERGAFTEIYLFQFLWHIVAPYSFLSLFLFCQFGLNDCLPARAKWGMAIRSFTPKRAKKEREKGTRSHNMPQNKIIWIRGLKEEIAFIKRRVWKKNSKKSEKIPFIKNYGITLIRGNYATLGRQIVLHPHCFLKELFQIFTLPKILNISKKR